jgi:hypothetical protein
MKGNKKQKNKGLDSNRDESYPQTRPGRPTFGCNPNDFSASSPQASEEASWQRRVDKINRGEDPDR